VLTHPTLDQLQALGLHGMARAFAGLAADPNVADLTHAEWLGLLPRPRSRMSITAPHAGSIASSSRRSPAGNGSSRRRT